ncbi:hypothetical protein QTN25_009218 [Entamoeba marina]
MSFTPHIDNSSFAYNALLFNSNNSPSSWSSLIEEQCLTIHHATIQLGNDEVCLRTQLSILYDLEHVFNIVNSTFFLLENDPLITTFKVLESNDPLISYYEVKIVDGVYPSNLICLRRSLEQRTSSCIKILITSSSHHQSLSKPNEHFGFFALVVEKCDDSCMITFLQQLPNNNMYSKRNIICKFSTYAEKKVKLLLACFDISKEIGNEQLVSLVNRIKTQKKCVDIVSNSYDDVKKVNNSFALYNDECNSKLKPKKDKTNHTTHSKSINEKFDVSHVSYNNTFLRSSISPPTHYNKDYISSMNTITSIQSETTTKIGPQCIENLQPFTFEKMYERKGIFPTSIKCIMDIFFPNCNIIKHHENFTVVKSPYFNDPLVLNIFIFKMFVLIQIHGDVVQNSTIFITLNSVQFNFTFLTTTKRFENVFPFIQSLEKHQYYHQTFEPFNSITPQQTHIFLMDSQQLKNILKYLSVIDIINLSKTCKHFYRSISALKKNPSTSFIPSI